MKEKMIKYFMLGNIILVALFVLECSLFTSKTEYKLEPFRENDLEIKPSKIPRAGNGVYAKVDLPSNETLGPYTGRLITDWEHIELSMKDEWHYVMGLNDCSKKYTKGLRVLDGRGGSIMTIINYAPKEFQNVKYHKICEFPYVQIVTIRPIKAGEELYVDYGTDYIYDFMEYPEVKGYFAKLKKKK